MAIARQDINGSVEDALKLLAKQEADLERQQRVITALKMAGDDVSDLQDMIDLQTRMLTLARKRIQSSEQRMSG